MNKKQGKSVKPLNKMVQIELKNLLSGFVAFAAAIVVLAVQGSLQPNGLAGKIGVFVLVAAIPLGIAAYIISMKVLHSEQVPIIGHQMADKSSHWAISSTGVGFMLILIDYSYVVFWGFAISCGVAIWFLSHTIKVWEKAELQTENVPNKEEPEN